MKIKHGKSYTKHLNNTPVSFAYDNYQSLFSPMVGTDYYGIGMAPMGYPLGYPFGSGSLKKGDIIGQELTFYDPLNPKNNTTYDIKSGLTGLSSFPGVSVGIPGVAGVGIGGIGGIAVDANIVKQFSNSDISVNVIGTEADVTKVVKILEKMYTSHADEIKTL